MRREWIFQSNTFEVGTRESNRKMYLLVKDTLAKLEAEMADPDINAMHHDLQAAFDHYNVEYTSRDLVRGTYEGKTLSFEQLLGGLPTQLRMWEGKVRAEFPEDSPTEREIFPNKRNPFLQGTYDDRIKSVKALSEKLREFPVLAETQAAVEAYYVLLDTARNLQQNFEGRTGQNSDLLEIRRVEVADTLYGVLGRLMYKFRNSREQVARFFDLSLLRRTGSAVNEGALGFSGTVPAGGTMVIPIPVDALLTAATTYSLINTSDEAPLTFFFAADASATDGVSKVTVQADETSDVGATDLGWAIGKPVLIVKNTGTEAGAYEVTIFVGGDN